MMQRFYEDEGEYVSIDQLIDWVRSHPLGSGRILPIIIWGGFGVGKCVRGSTPIWVNGAEITIQDLWELYAGAISPDPDGSGGEWSPATEKLRVASISEKGEMVEGQVTYLYRQRVSELGRRVILDDGSTITMTMRHRLRGLNGWQQEISVGDRICVPRTAPWGGAKVDPRLACLLAWQIAEGHEAADRPVVEISQLDRRQLERIRMAARGWADAEGIEMHSMPIYRDARSGVHRLVISSRPYRDWLEARGYVWGRPSAEKKLPDWLVAADESALRAFLGEFIACEGHVGANSAKLELSSASRSLIGQMNLICRRLDIWLRVGKKRGKASNGLEIKRGYWSGMISGESFYRLAEKVPVPDPEKQERIDSLAACRSAHKRSENTNSEGVPLSDLVVDLLTTTGLPKRRLGIDRNAVARQGTSRTAAQVAVSAATALADGSGRKRFEESSFAGQSGHPDFKNISVAFARLDLRRAAEISERMQARIDDEVHYARVVSVEDVWLDEYVYDLEVEEHHNYVAGGIICHNTQSIKAYGKTRGLEVRTYHPAHDVNGADIVGKAYHEKGANETRYALPAWLPTEDDAPEGLLFIDEMNRAPQEVLAGLMEPLGEGTIAQSGWKLPRGWNIIAAANPSEMGYMVQDLDEAMVDRMIHYAPGWDARYWGNWAQGAGIAPEIVDFALRNQGGLVVTGESQLPLEIENKLRTTPRTLEYMGALYEPGMPEGMLRVCSQGLMGRSAAAAFREQISSAERPLEAEQILAEPVQDANGHSVYPYEEKVRAWSEDKVEGDALIESSSERLVISLINEQPRSDDPRHERRASLAGRYLAFIPPHLRASAMNSIYRSAPHWAAVIDRAVLGWTEALARQQKVFTQRPAVGPSGDGGASRPGPGLLPGRQSGS